MKQILTELGLIDKVRSFYNSAKTFSPAILINEQKFRRNGLPDGFPAPDSGLIFLIIGLRWSGVYWNSGKQVFEMMKNVLEKNQIKLDSSLSILDFGCGCGRIIRHFYSYSKNNNYFGSDLNPELIKWSNKNLPFGNFSVNEIAPPLTYQNEMFNLIYARSVFTHIGPDLQKEWMKEFNRILKTGGSFYFTTHGESTFSNLTKMEFVELSNKGIFTVNQLVEGDNKCTVYQTRKYVEENLLDGFELLEFIAGTSGTNSPQDIYLIRKK
ncbi:MAG: class I SAM-dependent methyltransferase [Ignavibacteriales bacterium]|nr:class I SAM-dependent methyltransferase [Ignavibacteriales bacterium]